MRSKAPASTRVIGAALLLSLCLAGVTGPEIARAAPAWGAILTTFNGQAVHYNGEDPDKVSGDSGYGFRWQCVELIQRYYYTAGWSDKKRWGVGSAYQLFDPGVAPTGTVRHANGQPYLPEAGDVLVFAKTNAWPQGHAALVVGVSGGRITFVQQNVGTTARDSLGISGTRSTGYRIDTTRRSPGGVLYPAVRGWLHHLPQAPAGPTMVQVPASAGAGAVGPSVKAGQQVKIAASGTWCMGGSGQTAECGPTTGIRWANPPETDVVLPSAQIGTLLARIGTSGWFAVGSSVSFTASAAGPLGLLFNDRSCCYADNSGTISATISLGPPSQNLPPDPPSFVSPANDGRVQAPATFCWRSNGDPNGDPLHYLVVVSRMLVNGDTNNFSWATSSTCVAETDLDEFLAQIGLTSGLFAWHVVALDPSGTSSDASPCWNKSTWVSCHGDPWWSNFTLALNPPSATVNVQVPAQAPSGRFGGQTEGRV